MNGSPVSSGALHPDDGCFCCFCAHRYHKSQAIYLESKDNTKISCVISSVGTNEVTFLLIQHFEAPALSRAFVVLLDLISSPFNSVIMQSSGPLYSFVSHADSTHTRAYTHSSVCICGGETLSRVLNV